MENSMCGCECSTLIFSGYDIECVMEMGIFLRICGRYWHMV